MLVVQRAVRFVLRPPEPGSEGAAVAPVTLAVIGLLAMSCAYLMGAERVVAIDRFPYRLRMAREQAGAETINYEDTDVNDALKQLTAGRGPDACIDAVGMESHGMSPDNLMDHLKVKTFMATDRVHALRQVILATRKGGRVSIPGVYGGIADKFPIGALMEKGLTIRSGQTHVQKYMPELLELILEGRIDTTFLISHRLDLEDAATGYANFKDSQNEWTKVVLKPRFTRH